MKKSKMKAILKEILSTSIYLLCLLVAVFLVTEYVFQRTQVKGASMENTVHDGDHLIVDKITYRFQDPLRYDIIVFPYRYQENTYYIKRIIGLPNETIQIDERGVIYINGEVLLESYGKEVIKESGIATQEIQLGTNEYFLLGDNRNNSTDSRDSRVGVITRSEIIGRAYMRVWPLTDFKILEHQ
ncbi:MAG: signal peptidase I [Eubacteriales bacterium]